jgi:transcriptional regulator with XRE-family HTH domain
MAQSQDDRKALGARLASARKLAGLTMEEAARRLTERGYPISKQGLGHWESGRNLPDALWLRRLAKLYGTTLDALVWDEAISMEAIRFAAQYDGLSERQRRTFKAMWLAYFEQATTDEEVEVHLPRAPASQQDEVEPRNQTNRR